MLSLGVTGHSILAEMDPNGFNGNLELPLFNYQSVHFRLLQLEHGGGAVTALVTSPLELLIIASTVELNLSNIIGESYV